MSPNIPTIGANLESNPLNPQFLLWAKQYFVEGIKITNRPNNFDIFSADVSKTFSKVWADYAFCEKLRKTDWK